MHDRLPELLDAYLESRLTEAEAVELRALLTASLEARYAFWEYVEQHALIRDVLSETRGRDFALLGAGDTPCSLSDRAATPSRQRSFLRVALFAAPAVAILIALGLWAVRGEDDRHADLGSGADERAAAMPLGTVDLVSGDSRVTDRTGKSAVLTPGQALHPGEVLDVGEGEALLGGEESLLTLRLLDGTRMTLGSGASLRLPSSGPVGREEPMLLERGAIRVEVPFGSGPGLVVATAHGLIVSKEASFRLYREENASRVELERGMVSFTSRAGHRALDVPEGSFVIATDEPEPMAPRTLSPGQCRLRHAFLKAGDAAAISRDGSRIVTSRRGTGFKVWSGQDGELLESAPGIGERTFDMALSDRGDSVVAIGTEGTASMWDVNDPTPSRIRLRERGLRDSVVSADGRWLAQGASTGEVTVWQVDPDGGRISLRETLPIKPSRVALSGGAVPYIAISRWAGEISVIDIATGQTVARHRLQSTPTPLALSSDGRFVAAYGNKDGLVLFDRQADAQRTLWAGQGARVCDLHFSADGRVLLAGLGDGTVRAWGDDGRSLLVLETGYRHVRRVTATSDLSLIVTVGDGDCVKVWECTWPGKVNGPLEG